MNFQMSHYRDNKLIDIISAPNTLLYTGIFQQLEIMFKVRPKYSNWYFGLISAVDYLGFSLYDTLYNHPTWTEFVQYTPSTRQIWRREYPSDADLPIMYPVEITSAFSDISTIAAYHFIRGAFLTSAQIGTPADNVILAIVEFLTPKSLEVGDQLRCSYSCEAANYVAP